MPANFKLLCTSLVKLLLVSFCCFSCSGKKDSLAKLNAEEVLDRQANLTRSEARDGIVRKENKYKENQQKKLSGKDKAAVPIPKFSRMIITPAAPTVSDKLISFSVNEQTSIKDVLIELGRMTGIDIDIDPAISGGVIINAKNRPLKEVLERLAVMANIRYSYQNNLLRFERDSAYNKNYVVDYLSDGTLWTEVESNISKILSNYDNSTSDSAPNDSSSTSYSSNKAAGIITVFANSRLQSEVAKYLEKVQSNFSSQVLIEAKVVEVVLNENHRSGIDWSWTDQAANGATSVSGSNNTSFANTSPFVFAIGSAANPKRLFGGGINASINMLEEFGDVRTIASPRINALNNQKATLNFVDKIIYFTLSVTTNTVGATTATTTNVVTATKNEENVGVELTITPSINLETNEVTLSVNPKLSVQNGVAKDPSVNPVTGASLNNTVPIIQTRELNTTMKIQSGGILVIGGLMKETTSNNDSGLPILDRIPILGRLFKSISKTSEITETVIFIKASIVGSGSGVSKYDRDFHDRFISDKKDFFN